ncbi:S-adenosyl-L-methionine-dependent methyltransferase [Dothidotthia symphoricarpi CBS 119687]|uniref:S-adenosyl-L-methionine-dependent methyltransferase n=1 Tax=Dothidotthia symphoricarpi CBS 119687 TaxID=1392245 RepID=A0A6A6A915_9PLEO|nr:S-adenosyl-L-methionine-dependent methyltransferase [Dothidotthia symphoricarpi CBS 119687]KAF2128300.1 S-adenosyl-L-methionine-dependent methyltransferase [Dothidotthia symphoricarpi CBS 119687]
MTTSQTIGELNSEFFDSIAKSTYSADWVRNLVQQISSFLREHVEWIAPPKEGGWRVLDYACGSGIASMALTAHASVLRGIDISGGMVDQYNATALSLNLKPEQMHGVRGNILENDETLNGSEFQRFDVAIMSMALHHVEDPAAMVKKLTERLVPGGSLVIIDWLPHGEKAGEQGMRSHSHLISHYGFSEAEMQDMYAQAGLGDFGFLLHPEQSEILGGGMNQLFFARGKLPVSSDP